MVAKKKDEKPTKESVFRKQKDYDGSVEEIDTAIYNVEIECKDKDCHEIRYIKPQDKFQVKYCKPHQRKYSRLGAKKAKKAAGKTASKAARRASKSSVAPAAAASA